MSTLSDIMDRLKLATASSNSLNMAIWCELNPDRDPFTYNGDPRWGSYTLSIDEAVKLVPDICYARVQTESRDCPPIAWVTDEAQERSWEGIGANAAIALCIAALQARAALTSQHPAGGE